jgi:hypothetical protein
VSRDLYSWEKEDLIPTGRYNLRSKKGEGTQWRKGHDKNYGLGLHPGKDPSSTSMGRKSFYIMLKLGLRRKSWKGSKKLSIGFLEQTRPQE